MAEWTAQDQARADFVAAAIAYFRGQDSFDDVDVNSLASVSRGVDALGLHRLRATMREKWHAYRDLLDGKADNAPLDPARWYCPHCGKERPAFNFHLVGAAIIGMGAITYINVFCAEETCRKLLTVAIVGFVPEAQIMAQMQQQMKGKIHAS